MIVTQCARVYQSMGISGNNNNNIVVMYVKKAVVLENVLEWLC